MKLVFQCIGLGLLMLLVGGGCAFMISYVVDIALKASSPLLGTVVLVGFCWLMASIGALLILKGD